MSDMVEDANRAVMFGRYYAVASIALSAIIFLVFTGTLSDVIGAIVLFQGLAFVFVTRFWAGFETFTATRDWAAGHSARVEAPAANEGRSGQAAS